MIAPKFARTIARGRSDAAHDMLSGEPKVLTPALTIVDVVAGVFAFIFEMLVWSFIGFWTLCGAVFSGKSRAKIAGRWRQGPKHRLRMIAEAAFWIPVFAIGFGLGLPLVYGLITKSSQESPEAKRPAARPAKFVVQHPRDSTKEVVISSDRSRIRELGETKDLSELADKLREISAVDQQATPKPPSEPSLQSDHNPP